MLNSGKAVITVGGISDEVAAIVAFFAAEKAAYITGQTIRVDGGVTRSM